MTTPTTDAIASGADGASMFTPSSTKPEVVTLQAMIEAYLQEYEVRQFRINIARCRVAHLRAYFGEACLATDITAYRIQQYQVARRQQGAATGTVNRETSALTRMFRIVTEWGGLEGAPLLPGRLRGECATPDARGTAVRNQIETLLFGPMNVTRAVLPVMRTQRSGLVLTISSGQFSLYVLPLNDDEFAGAQESGTAGFWDTAVRRPA